MFISFKNSSSLGADSVLAKENEEEQEGSKRIELDNSSSNLIHPVEKEVYLLLFYSFI